MANREQHGNKEKKKPKSDKNKAKPPQTPQSAFGDARNQKAEQSRKK